jgi:outer membrane protein insertion porin family
LFTFGDGSSRNLAYTIGLSRNNKGVNPIFPTYGSEFSVSGKFTIPYSLFNNVDYADLKNQKEYKLRNEGTTNIPTTDGTGTILPGEYIDANGNRVLPENYQNAAVDQGKVDQKKFNWLEYYKIKFKADWFTKIYGKLVLRSLSEFGYLGAYNQARGLVPFERFFVGGDGLANFAQDGREVIQLRGYPNNSLSTDNGGAIYNKFSLELRYPITLKSSASIYVLTFLEGGNAYDSFNRYNPFQLKRSAGAGLRIFMPAFGLLGIDFGYGFDPLTGQTKANGLETHFIIGQQF